MPIVEAEKALQGVEVTGGEEFWGGGVWGPKEIKSNMQISQIQWKI